MNEASTPPGPLPWEGHCRCGKLRFRITQPPLVSALCHCLGCQRMSSSAFSLTLMVPTSGVEVSAGKPVVGGMRGDDLRHEFCESCMTWVLTRVDAFGIVNVRATLLEEARWFVPYLETYTSTRLPWAATPAERRFDEFPPTEAMPQLMADYAAWAQARGWPSPSDPTSPVPQIGSPFRV